MKIKLDTAYALSGWIAVLVLSVICNIEWMLWLAIAFIGVLIIDICYNLKKENKNTHHETAGGGTLEERLNSIILKFKSMSGTAQERLEKALTDLNAATNDIAADLEALKDQIKAGTVNEESLTALEGNIEVLKGLGNQQ